MARPLAPRTATPAALPLLIVERPEPLVARVDCPELEVIAMGFDRVASPARVATVLP